jgi:hypothetical protein
LIPEPQEDGTIDYRPCTRQTYIKRLLDKAGVSPKNPQYAEMVMRTNVLESYRTGVDQQAASESMKENFPVWQYQGILDGREGDDHRPKFGRYYPAKASFAEVRGDRPFNCRCNRRNIHRLAWAKLMAEGASIETEW